MPDNELKIKVKFDDTQARTSILQFRALNSQVAQEGLKAGRDQAQAAAKLAEIEKIEAKGKLELARAGKLTAQAATEDARAKAQQATASQAATSATEKETRAAEALYRARSRVTPEQRRQVAGEDRQQRDEGYYLRQQRSDQESAAARGESQRQARGDLAGQASVPLAVGGAAAVAGLVYAGDQAGKFDAMLVQMRNNTQMTDQEFDAFRQHILKVGHDTGASMDELAAAVLRAKNHGFDLAESLKVVDAATKSALATGSDIGETANVLSQTMHIFSMSADKAAPAMNTLHMAALLGNTTLQQFVDSFGMAEAVTSKYGLTLQDTAATFATMTQNGLDAATSGTQLRDVLQHIVNPGKAAKEELVKLSKATGIDLVNDFTAGALRTKGLSGVLVDLNKATHGHAEEVIKLIPAQRGSFGAMATMGQGAIDLEKNLGILDKTMAGKLDPTTEGFERQQKTLAAQTARLQNALLEMEISLGQSVVPMLTNAAKAVSGLADGFRALDPATQGAIVKVTLFGAGLAIVAGGALGAAAKVATLVTGLKDAGIAFGTVTEAAGAAEVAEGGMAAAGVAAMAPAGPILIGIGLVAAAIWGIVTAWNAATNAIDKYNHDAALTPSGPPTQDVRDRKASELTDAQSQIDANNRQIAYDQAQKAGVRADMSKGLGLGEKPDEASIKQQMDSWQGSIDALKKANDALIAHADKLRSDVGNMTDIGDVKRSLQTAIDNSRREEARNSRDVATLRGNHPAYANGNLVDPINLENGVKVTTAKQLQSEIAALQARQAEITTDRKHNQNAIGLLPDIGNSGSVAGKRVADAIASGAADHIKTPDGQASCAFFASQLMRSVGLSIPKTGGAKALKDELEAAGAKPKAAAFAKPGDIIVYQGDRYGAHQGGGARSGFHVAAMGPGGNLVQSSDGRITHPGFYDQAHATAYTIPDSLLPKSGKPDAGYKGSPSDDDLKQKAALLVAQAGEKADDAKRAFEKAKESYSDTHNLNYWAAAKQLRETQATREISEADASRKEKSTGDKADPALATEEYRRKVKDVKDAEDKDLREHDRTVNGSLADRQKAILDVAQAGLERKAKLADLAVQRLEALVSHSTDPRNITALQNAYALQSNIQAQVIKHKAQAELDDVPNTPENAARRQAITAREANDLLEESNKLTSSLADLDAKRAEIAQRQVKALQDQNAATTTILQARLSAAQTDDEKLAAERLLAQQNLQKISLDQKEAVLGVNATFDPLIKGATDPGQRAALTGQKQAAIDQANQDAYAKTQAETLRATSEITGTLNDQTSKRADRLRTEADLTDDLSVKMDKLSQAYRLMLGITPGSEDRRVMTEQYNQDTHNLSRDKDAQDAQRMVAAGISGNAPAMISGALDTLKSLITDTQATQAQAQDARSQYNSQLVDLVRDKQESGQDALSRVLDPGIRKGATAGEMAASIVAAKDILTALLQNDFERINQISNPLERQRELDALKRQTANDPLIRQAGLTSYGVKIVQDQQANQTRNSQTDQMFQELSQGAARAGSDIIRNLFQAKNRKDVFKTFWKELEDAGESTLADAIQKQLQKGIENIFQNGLSSLGSGLGGLFGGHGSAGSATGGAGGDAGSALGTAASAGASAASAGTGAAASGAAGASASGGAFSSLGSIAPYLAAAAVLSNPAIVKAITDYVNAAAKAVATVIQSLGQMSAAIVEGYGKAIAAVIQASGKAVEEVGKGVGSAVSGIGDGIGKAASGIGDGISKVIGSITGGNAMRVATMNVANMSHATIIQGGAAGAGGGSLLASLGAAVGGPVGGAIGSVLGSLFHFAAGTDNAPLHTPIIVGEHGPEMVVPHSSAKIMTAAQTAKIMGMDSPSSPAMPRSLARGYEPAAPGQGILGSGGVMQAIASHSQTLSNSLRETITKSVSGGGDIHQENNYFGDIHKEVDLHEYSKKQARQIDLARRKFVPAPVG